MKSTAKLLSSTSSTTLLLGAKKSDVHFQKYLSFSKNLHWKFFQQGGSGKKFLPYNFFFLSPIEMKSTAKLFSSTSATTLLLRAKKSDVHFQKYLSFSKNLHWKFFPQGGGLGKGFCLITFFLKSYWDEVNGKVVELDELNNFAVGS